MKFKVGDIVAHKDMIAYVGYVVKIHYDSYMVAWIDIPYIATYTRRYIEDNHDLYTDILREEE